ncbi:MAG: sensor domain-containing diguanylate cyclase [Pseudomonadota bacterium]
MRADKSLLYDNTVEKLQTVDEVVARLVDDPVALAKLVEEHRLLVEAIESAPMPYCVYDQDDFLIAANPAYERLHPAITELRQKLGRHERVNYADIVRRQLSGMHDPEEIEREVRQRLIMQRLSDGVPVERTYADIGTFSVVKCRLKSGGVVGVASDITDLKKRESELLDASQKAERSEARANAALAAERTRQSQTRSLSELGEWLQSCKSLNELYGIVSKFMTSCFPDAVGELYTYSNSRDVLDGSCAWGGSSTLHDHIQPDDCWALRRGRLLKFGSGVIDFPCHHVDQADAPSSDQHYVCIPLIAHGDTIGLIHIRFPDADAAGNDPVDAVLQYAIQCAEQISLAIANVRLRHELEDQSTKDALTGLWNRRYLMNRCRQELIASRRSGTPVSMIMLDADHFKQLNDTHGHDAGDRG